MAPIEFCPRITLLLLLMLLSTSAGAQTLVQEWVRVYDSGQADQAMDLEVAPNGMVYVLDSRPRYDFDTARVLAYGADGVQLWVGEMDSLWANDLAVTTSSGAVIAGGRSDGSTTKTAIVQFEADGDTLWSWVHGWATWDEAMAVAVDGSDHIFAAIDCDNCTPTNWATQILHLDPLGHMMCREAIDAANNLRPDQIVASMDGIYVAGSYDYDPPTGPFIARTDQGCTTDWLYTFFSGAHGTARALVKGDWLIYSAGYAEFNNGRDVLATRQFLFDGELHWQGGGGLFDLSGGHDEAMALAVPSAFEVYVTGYGTTSSGGRDVLTVKNPGWDDSWYHTYDGPGTAGDDVGVDIEMLGTSYVATLATVDAGSRGQDIVVLLYDLAGTYLGQVHYSGPGPGTPDVAVAMEPDGQGGLYVAGTTGDDIIVIKYRLATTSADWVAGSVPSPVENENGVTSG